MQERYPKRYSEILGREMERQKPLPTLLSLGIVTLAARLVLILMRQF